ncbi:MAG TPA: YgeY family selenium metabolism-linked hydrolase [Chloroflexota bacterium]|nr:YgeY family selenium metabolism-linked hydrolase [Chloroflexota bacterium]
MVDRNALIEFTLRLVAEKSPSAQEAGVAMLVAAEMTRLGYRVETDRLGNVIGSIGAENGPSVLIDAHMDTVGVTDRAAWTYDPSGQHVGERLYGRGTVDMKGPLAAAIHGIAGLRRQLTRGRIVVSASIAEEMIEGVATEAVAKRVRPDFAIIAEPSSSKLARGQRGRAEVTVRTSGKPTHSSRPDLGLNAAEAMADVIVALRDVPAPSHPVLGEGILVLTDIISRPYPALSVVPDLCIATYDRRTLPGETEEDALGPIRKALLRGLQRTGAEGSATIADDDFRTYTGVQIVAPNFAPAWFFADDSEVVRKASDGLRQAGIEPVLTHYAFCTNGSGTAGRLGIPTIGFGPGDETLAHRTDEFIEVEELVTGADAYAGIAQTFLA